MSEPPEARAAVANELEAMDVNGTFVEADFASVDAVRGLSDTVRTETDGLGVESTFHVNHLSPSLPTTELVATPAVRDRFRSGLDVDDESPVGERVRYRNRGGN